MTEGLRCGALNKNGGRCTSDAVAETNWWRCLKHEDWHRTATREQKERLAILEIEETIQSLGPVQREDLETRRKGMRDLYG